MFAIRFFILHNHFSSIELILRETIIINLRNVEYDIY
jgi:hypothetical protein